MSEGRKALLLVLIFALLLGGWSLYYNWLYDTEMEKLSDSTFSDTQAIRQINAQIDREKEERESMSEDYYLIIPKASDLAGIHQYVYKTAEKHKLELSGVNLSNSPNTSAGKLSSVDFNFSVSGKYMNVRAFLQDLYNNQRFLKLVNWSWGGASDGNLSMNLSYETYYYPNKDESFLDAPVFEAYKPAERVNPTE